MAILTAEFNPVGATNGATIATTDTGDLTAWNSTAGTAPKYDNTHTLFGKALAAKFVQSASTSALIWTTGYAAIGNGGADFGRLYIYLSSLPSAIVAVARGYNGGVNDAGVWITTSGKVVVARGAGTVLATSTTTLATGQWYRLEWHWTFSSSQAITCAIYASPDSSTATETVSSTGNFNTAPIQLIVGSSQTANWTQWMASVVAAGTAAIGPYPVNSVAPSVSGSTPVGSTLTTTNGTWNSTFTFTYQWTQDGTNIAGATSSTYVTQSGDAGHAIGCKVTATGVQATNEAVTQASSNTITVASSSVFVPQIMVFT